MAGGCATKALLLLCWLQVSSSQYSGSLDEDDDPLVAVRAPLPGKLASKLPHLPTYKPPMDVYVGTGCESIQVTIWVGGVHTVGESGLNQRGFSGKSLCV